MRTRPGRALSSPLARRIHRHSQLSVLFRAPDIPAGGGTGIGAAASGRTSGGGTTGGAAGGAVNTTPGRPAPAKALWLPHPAQPGLPSVQSIPPQPEVSPLPADPPPAWARPPARLEPPARMEPPAPQTPGSAAQPLAAQPPAARLPAGQPPAAQPPAGLPLTEPTSAAAQQAEPQPVEPQPADEGIWRRLQNIYRKHEQKRGGKAEERSEQAAPAEAVPPDTAQVIQAKARPDPPAGTQPPAPEPLSGVSGKTPPLPPAAETTTGQPELDQPRPTVQAAGEPEARAAAESAPVEPGRVEPIRPAADQRTPADAGVAADNVPPARVEPPKARPPDDLPRQAVPLQDAWPVQRQPQARSSREQAEPGRSETEQSAPLRPEPGRPGPAQPSAVQPDGRPPDPTARGDIIQAAGEQARRVLSSVATGQPSASAVEFVPPRQPRPASLPSGPVMRRVEEPPPLSRAEGQPGGVAPEEPEMVPTEIGPLPGDLWRLIRQTPPAPPIHTEGHAADQTVDRPAQHPADLAPRKPDAPAGERTPGPIPSARPAMPARPAAAVSRTPAPSPAPARAPGVVVQRQPLEAPAPPVNQAQPEDEEEGEVDLDELARQVYERVRRRLRVERERHRR